jgi:hypothetical protein
MGQNNDTGGCIGLVLDSDTEDRIRILTESGLDTEDKKLNKGKDTEGSTRRQGTELGYRAQY